MGTLAWQLNVEGTRCKNKRCYFGMRSHVISVQHTVPPYSVPGYDLGERRRGPLRIIKKQFQLGCLATARQQKSLTQPN